MLFCATVFVLILITLLLTNGYRWLYILYKTLPRDLKAGYRFFHAEWKVRQWEKSRATVPKLFHELAKKHPKKVLFLQENKKWTFGELEDFSNQVAHYFKSKGYKKGDSVALLLENRPEYVGIWLGLSKIGVITALINTNLVSDLLTHSISVAQSKALIYGSDFANAVNCISSQIKDLELFEFTDQEPINNHVNLNKEICNESTVLPNDVRNLKPSDKIVYIFTSGTTGMPKAAIISNTRYMFTAAGIYYLTGLSHNDVYYNPLPLYHSAGGMLAIGQGICFGLTVVLRKKFSATNFWIDCQKHNCTAANYIGEICRYLLAVHKPDAKIDHPVKKMIGNGLRPQIWNEFIKTFGIENVYEFYGSTEGNSNLMNIDNKIGAVGFIPRYADFIYKVNLIKYDETTGEPIRNSKGLCIRCLPNEPGILVGKINKKRVHTEFEGYADSKATQKKVLKDVFEKGDLYFNSGDVLIQDEFGYFYFKDRTGDTFRWKGENVATAEVEAVVSNVAELHDAVVYGVQIPGTEGRAGMAAIVDINNSLDLKKLASGLKKRLPGYAVPIFLRIMDSLPMTGTFKLKKVDLQKEGFDFDKITDHRLYYLDIKASEYLPLTKDIYNDIISGRMRF